MDTPPPPALASPYFALSLTPPSPSLPLFNSAERRDGGGFVSGFILGGVVFGALGFLFAPQVREKEKKQTTSPRPVISFSFLQPHRKNLSLSLLSRSPPPSCPRTTRSSCPASWRTTSARPRRRSRYEKRTERGRQKKEEALAAFPPGPACASPTPPLISSLPITGPRRQDRPAQLGHR